MITDHTQATSELQQIVEQEDITLPTQPVGKDAAVEAKLRRCHRSDWVSTIAKRHPAFASCSPAISTAVVW